MISKERMADIVESIKELADEIHSQKNKDPQEFGQLLAYAEALSIIRDAVDSSDLREIGLDFDIDARYLYGD